ncbi:hypothetical protein FRB93_013207 [Tulasnella sp. JGI-2019a]|nr:hypothetical protein FRB93_013207 [Tulasnella sp. JGI-2019a]
MRTLLFGLCCLTAAGSVMAAPLLYINEPRHTQQQKRGDLANDLVAAARKLRPIAKEPVTVRPSSLKKITPVADVRAGLRKVLGTKSATKNVPNQEAKAAHPPDQANPSPGGEVITNVAQKVDTFNKASTVGSPPGYNPKPATHATNIQDEIERGTQGNQFHQIPGTPIQLAHAPEPPGTALGNAEPGLAASGPHQGSHNSDKVAQQLHGHEASSAGSLQANHIDGSPPASVGQHANSMASEHVEPTHNTENDIPPGTAKVEPAGGNHATSAGQPTNVGGIDIPNANMNQNALANTHPSYQVGTDGRPGIVEGLEPVNPNIDVGLDHERAVTNPEKTSNTVSSEEGDIVTTENGKKPIGKLAKAGIAGATFLTAGVVTGVPAYEITRHAEIGPGFNHDGSNVFTPQVEEP